MTPKTQRARFQFDLRDLLFVTALTFLGMCVFYPILHNSFADHSHCMPRMTPLQSFLAGLTIVGFTALGSFLGIWRANSNRCVSWMRGLTLTCCCVYAWFLMFLLFMPSLPSRGCGCNESAVIAACKTYAESQDIYRRTDWDNDGIPEYALTISGANSLYERRAGTGDLTLVDAAFASAEGAPGVAQPKAGYVFKVLTGQGPNAPGGRKSYIVNGNMTMGYALVACPASYDSTGRNTYLISNTGTVYQKDLGSDTAKIVKAMTEYDPGPGWVVSE